MTEHFSPNYYKHPLVKKSKASALPVPLSVYIDAAPYSLTDSCLGVWLEELVTGRRFVLALLRKRRVCKCGCRGWCTYWTLMNWLKHCFVALAEGKWPRRRHDGEKWTSQDGRRASRAGEYLLAIGALIQLRGDWPEFCERLGMPTWASHMRPCFVCNAEKHTWFDFSSCTPVSSPWHLNEHEDYMTACSRCEHKIIADAGLIKRLSRCLKYDKRARGNHGRCLTENLPEVNLLAGDRLEPSANLVDVADLERMCKKPGETVELTFWRCGEETMCSHRCPLWDASLGITAPDVVVFDTLHTLNLGVMQLFVKCALWKLIKAGAWSGFGTEGLAVQVCALRHELFAWYKTYKDEELTRVADFVPSMIGKQHT